MMNAAIKAQEQFTATLLAVGHFLITKKGNLLFFYQSNGAFHYYGFDRKDGKWRFINTAFNTNEPLKTFIRNGSLTGKIYALLKNKPYWIVYIKEKAYYMKIEEHSHRLPILNKPPAFNGNRPMPGMSEYLHNMPHRNLSYYNK